MGSFSTRVHQQQQQQQRITQQEREPLQCRQRAEAGAMTRGSCWVLMLWSHAGSEVHQQQQQQRIMQQGEEDANGIIMLL
jgi:hypothetical protein